MNGEPSSRSWIQFLAYAVIGVVTLMLVSSMIPALPLKILMYLPFGWIGFLRRVGPEITLNWSGVGMGLLCSALIIAGIQWLGSGFARRPQLERLGRWRWGWSVALYAAVWLLFLAAMGVTGVAHQLGWLARSKEPLYVLDGYGGDGVWRLQQEASILELAAQEAGWDAAKARRAYWEAQLDRGPVRSRANALEEFETIFVPDSKGSLTAAVIYHRDAVRQARYGFTVVRRTEEVGLPRPMKELPGTLAHLERAAR